MRTRQKDGLKTIVERFPKKSIKHSGNERFINYCDNGSHRGITLTPRVCIVRRCQHYHRLKIENPEYERS